jgi:hypothetical protein
MILQEVGIVNGVKALQKPVIRAGSAKSGPSSHPNRGTGIIYG